MQIAVPPTSPSDPRWPGIQFCEQAPVTQRTEAKVSADAKWLLASVILLLLDLGMVSLASRITTGGGVSFTSDQRLSAYLRIALLECLVFGYVLFGVHRTGECPSRIIHRRPDGLQGWFSSGVIGIAGAVVWMAIGAAIMAGLKPTADDLRIVQSFLPHNAQEKAGFVLLTLTAGFYEEFIYRGYLQDKLRFWTGSVSVAIILQARLFALLHVTLPWKFVVSVTAMAVFLGVLTHWRKSLVSAMVLHATVNWSSCIHQAPAELITLISSALFWI